MTTVGTGDYTYELVQGWPKLPEYWAFECASDVAVDSQDRVYIFNRGSHPLIIADRDGHFITSWGEGLFRVPHGIYIGPDDMVYLSDVQSHVVMKFTPKGELLLTLGKKDFAEVTYYGRSFNMPTGLALSPSGDMFISDGYGNRRVHKYSPDGKLLLSWGEPGTGPGQFAVVHNIGVDRQGRVYVCDRENNRIQVFDDQGKFITQWSDCRSPGDVYIGKDDIIYVAEQGSQLRGEEPPRVTIRDLQGQILSQWEGEELVDSPHGIWVNSRGDVYVAELSGRVQMFAKK